MIEELILADTADLIMSSDWLVIASWGRMDGWTDIQTDRQKPLLLCSIDNTRKF